MAAHVYKKITKIANKCQPLQTKGTELIKTELIIASYKPGNGKKFRQSLHCHWHSLPFQTLILVLNSVRLVDCLIHSGRVHHNYGIHIVHTDFLDQSLLSSLVAFSSGRKSLPNLAILFKC